MSHPKGRHYRRWLLGITAMLLLVLEATLLLPSFNKKYIYSMRDLCGAHLREIGLAIQLYAIKHQGHFPDSLPILLSDAMADDDWPDAAGIFVCPSSSDVPASGPTTRAITANLAEAGHLSYIYLGRGLTDKTATAKTVVAYEPLSHHHNGINVLFGDGRVDFICEPQASQIIKTVQNQKAFPTTSGN